MAETVLLADSREVCRERVSDNWKMSLTAALLDVAVNGVSFATPGHRCGRSCRAVPDATITESGA
jgi:hypothetical protein